LGDAAGPIAASSRIGFAPSQKPIAEPPSRTGTRGTPASGPGCRRGLLAAPARRSSG